MKKIICLILALSFFTLTSSNVFGVASSPAGGNRTPGASSNISIIAQPETGENAVTIRITATNMTITNFVPVSGGNWIGAIGECAGSAYYTSTTVCLSLSKSSDITTSEVLGTLTATFGSSGTATLATTSGTEYSDGSDARASTGTIATFSVLADALPETSEPKESKLKYLLSALLISLSITSFVILRAALKKKESQNI